MVIVVIVNVLGAVVVVITEVVLALVLVKGADRDPRSVHRRKNLTKLQAALTGPPVGRGSWSSAGVLVE